MKASRASYGRPETEFQKKGHPSYFAWLFSKFCVLGVRRATHQHRIASSANRTRRAGIQKALRHDDDPAMD